jgi:Ca2+-binding EF-hand superfamily protein
MATDVQKQRLNARYSLWDKDKDGKVVNADFTREVDNLVNALGPAANAAKVSNLKTTYTSMFDAGTLAGKFLPGGAVVGGLTGAVSQVVWSRDLMEKIFDAMVASGGEQAYGLVIDPVIGAIGSVLDTDGDGNVKLPEFRAWYSAMGLSQTVADAAFAAIDTDGDGSCPVQAIVDAVRNFHLGKLDAPLLG